MNRAEKKFRIWAMVAIFALLTALLAVINAVSFTMAGEDAVRAMSRDLAEAGYERGAPALASAYNNRGGILKTVGRYEDASADYARAIEELERTADPDPLTLARMHYNAGSCAVSAGENAARYFDKYQKLKLEVMQQKLELFLSLHLLVMQQVLKNYLKA